MTPSYPSSYSNPSSFFVSVYVLLSCWCLIVHGAIRVHVETDFGASKGILENGSEISYSVVNGQNETLFPGGDLAFFVKGTWCVAPSRYSALHSLQKQIEWQQLVPTYEETVNGTIPGLGDYQGIRVQWFCDLPDESNHNHDTKTSTFSVITSFLNFDSKRSVVFDVTYPSGAENTSLVVFNETDGETATLATFPSFVIEDAVNERNSGRNGIPKSSTFPSALSWEGSFVQSVRGLSVGPRGGPTVFYNASDSTLSNVVLASPFFDVFVDENSSHHFNQFTAGNNLDWTGTLPSFSPGKSGRLTSIPPGSSQSFLLYQGSKCGITSAISEWGNVLQTASQPFTLSSRSSTSSNNSTNSSMSAITSKRVPNAVPSLKRPKLDDVTLEKIGYQTDNGAMYCFCDSANCSKVLLEEKAYLDSIGIPIGYLSFQGAGTSSGRGQAAPWCIQKWSADGGQDPNKYPLDTKEFQKALEVPLQLYAPYFCPDTTEYFQPDTPFTSLKSNTDLPGCSDFAFEMVRASDSKAFFEWFLTKGIEKAGMVSFESDFMNQNVNCVEEFIDDPIHGADELLEGMTEAALGFDIPIQWCYASPNVVMASLNYPAVTNFRVSFDYCYGKSYDIGESSLLVWAVGSAPSKDTLWTTENNRTETPGCEWTVDHETVAAELHVVLAIMSTGPVGISDATGMTNATLLRRIISSDGSLLQPSKPITAVDSSFLDTNFKPDGFVYGTHGLQMSWIFVSFQLQNPFTVTKRDFWPPLEALETGENTDTTMRLVHRTFGSTKECVDGEDAIASGCVSLVSMKDDLNDSYPVFVAPKSTFDSPGSDLKPNVVTVWKECPGRKGIFFLGELSKYVAVSPKRFRSLECSELGVSATIVGGVNEMIEITLLVAQEREDGNLWYMVVKDKIAISNPRGIVQFDYNLNNVDRQYSKVVIDDVSTADA